MYRHLLLPESGFTPVGLVDLPIRQLSRREPYSGTLRCQFAERRGQKSEPVFSATWLPWDEQIATATKPISKPCAVLLQQLARRHEPWPGSHRRHCAACRMTLHVPTDRIRTSLPASQLGRVFDAQECR